MGVYPLESPLTQAIRRARLYREGRLTYLFVRQQVADDVAFRVADEQARDNGGSPGVASDVTHGGERADTRSGGGYVGGSVHRAGGALEGTRPTSLNASALDEGAEGPPVSFARQEGQTGPVLVVRADTGPTNFDKGGNDG